MTPRELYQKIAPSNSAYERSPATYQGCVEKVTKRFVNFNVGGKTYTINTHGVLCSRTERSDGKTWYSYCSTQDELFENLSDDRVFADLFAVSRDAKGLIFK